MTTVHSLRGGRAWYDDMAPPVQVRDRLVPETIFVDLYGDGEQPSLQMKIEVRQGVPVCTELRLTARPGGRDIRAGRSAGGAHRQLDRAGGRGVLVMSSPSRVVSSPSRRRRRRTGRTRGRPDATRRGPGARRCRPSGCTRRPTCTAATPTARPCRSSPTCSACPNAPPPATSRSAAATGCCHHEERRKRDGEERQRRRQHLQVDEERQASRVQRCASPTRTRRRRRSATWRTALPATDVRDETRQGAGPADRRRAGAGRQTDRR